jgi:hypothetical protein
MKHTMQRAAILLVALVMCVGTASAQADSSRYVLSISAGIPASNGETARELYTIGVQWTQSRPNRLSADFAAGFMPRLLTNSILGVGLRGGVTIPLQVAKGAFLLPAAGVSVIGAAGGGGADGAYGPHLGMAAVLLGQKNVGLRAGATYHLFRETRDGVWLLELGVAFRR